MRSIRLLFGISLLVLGLLCLLPGLVRINHTLGREKCPDALGGFCCSVLALELAATAEDFRQALSHFGREARKDDSAASPATPLEAGREQLKRDLFFDDWALIPTYTALLVLTGCVLLIAYHYELEQARTAGAAQDVGRAGRLVVAGLAIAVALAACAAAYYDYAENRFLRDAAEVWPDERLVGRVRDAATLKWGLIFLALALLGLMQAVRLAWSRPPHPRWRAVVAFFMFATALAGFFGLATHAPRIEWAALTAGSGLIAAAVPFLLDGLKAQAVESRPPLEVWEVLRDEYESFHGRPPEGDFATVDFTADQIINPIVLAGRLHAAQDSPVTLEERGREETGALLRQFNQLLDTRADLSRRWAMRAELCQNLARRLNDQLDNADLYARCHRNAYCNRELLASILLGAGVSSAPGDPDPQNVAPARRRVINRRILDELFSNEVKSLSEVRLAMIYEQVRQQPERHAALCLSGGGIRSATFNLGVLQGLARYGLLDKFHYLSTVSGGGFIGGWLSAWIYRHPEHEVGVARELSQSPPAALEPDPHPLTHLRSYSNFLSPQVGLLSPDTWTMVAMVLRNLLLIWLVFVPALAALLLLPRFWLLAVISGPQLPWLLYLGAALGAFAIFEINRNLPFFGNRDYDQRGYLLRCLLPLLSASVCLVLYWAQINRGLNEDALRRVWPRDSAAYFVALSQAMVFVPWLLYVVWYGAVQRKFARRYTMPDGWIIFFASVLVLLSQLVTGAASWYAAVRLFPAPDAYPHFYAALAVPSLLLWLGLGGTLLAGVTSHFMSDTDQEWWARSGAWLLIAAFGWVVFCGLVYFGPLIFVAWPPSARFWEWSLVQWVKVFGTVFPLVSGVIALAGGFTSKTPATGAAREQASPAARALGSAAGLLAPVFLIFLLTLIAFGANWLLVANPLDHLRALLEVSPRRLAAALAGLGVAAFAASLLISTNKFSLHFFWRNRLIHAYLGASRPPQERRPNRFTGFDPQDNLEMWRLRAGFHQNDECAATNDGRYTRGKCGEAGYASRRHKRATSPEQTRLLHVLNIALNLVGSKRLAWQERKAESFTVSPLHAGSSRLGYRPSCEYTEGGITLGTAVATSGAFASPNMGYMMTSPVLRFLMTLFNARFGWWLGNPGNVPGGSRLVSRVRRFFDFEHAYRHDSPTLSLVPIVQEALGQTDDRSSYVYLSDGGHFENLGLYEMVLRRCRLIVVSDASTDPDYSFSSLGQSIRQIRIDLGVPIELKEFSVTGPGISQSGKYCAVGIIKYSCVDRQPDAFPEHEALRKEDAEFDGVLIYIKPSLLGTEPRDVLNYASGSASFPQEFIGDQWFSESQFESYRALGSHIVTELCGGEPRRTITFDEFQRSVTAHVQNLSVFDEQIRSAIFAEEIKSFVQPRSATELQRRMQDYLNSKFDGRDKK